MQSADVGKVFNDEWISEHELPDPNPLPRVVGWKLLIRPVQIRRQTKGGILLPDKMKDDISYLTTVGRVLAIGPMAYSDPEFGGPWCQVGDFVTYGKFVGKRLVYRGVRLLLVQDKEIDLVITDPNDIDPTFNISSGSV